MGGWSLIVPTVVDTIFKALAPAMRRPHPRRSSWLLGGSIVFIGKDPSTNANFVLQSLEGGGWGGRPHGDGESASVSVCQGNVKNSPIESMEIKTPVVVEERSLRTDSGGPASIAAASASTCASATSSRASGTCRARAGGNARRGGFGAAGRAAAPSIPEAARTRASSIRSTR